MTVNSSVSDVIYTGDGTSTVFTVPFYFLADSHLSVTRVNADTEAATPLVLNTDYTVSGAGVQTGGAITLTVAPTSSQKIYIFRDVPIDQQVDFTPNDKFPAEVNEQALDKLTMICQQIATGLTSAIRYPLSEFGTDGTLPLASARADMLFGFDANGIQEMVPRPSTLGAGDLRMDVFVAGTDFTPDVTTSLTLSRAPISAGNCWAYWDGVAQLDFSLNGTTINFPTPIPSGISRVYVRIGTTLSQGVPPQQSVGDDQLVWGTSLRHNFNSIAALRATTDARFVSCSVTGYYAPLDGGGGEYEVDTSDTTSADNGGSIIVDGLSRRWKLNGPPDWYVEQFGAKGDGVTDDAPAFNAALAALPAHGGYVRMRGKNYGLGSAVVVGTGDGGANASAINGIHLIGMGAGLGARPSPPTILTALTTQSGAMMRISGSINDTVLEGFCLYGNLKARICLQLTAACGTQIKNVALRQFTYAGMYWHGGVSPTGNYNIHNQIHNVDVASTANGHFGLLMDGDYASVNDTWLTSFYNCRFDTTSATNSIAAYFSFVDSCSFYRCHFVGNNTAGVGLSGCYGIYFSAVGNAQYPGGMAFHDCSILSTYVNESATEKIGYMSFINYGVDDNEQIPTHTKLRGFTIHGTPFNGWGT